MNASVSFDELVFVAIYWKWPVFLGTSKEIFRGSIPAKLLRYLGINNFEKIAGVQNRLEFIKNRSGDVSKQDVWYQEGHGIIHPSSGMPANGTFLQNNPGLESEWSATNRTIQLCASYGRSQLISYDATRKSYLSPYLCAHD